MKMACPSPAAIFWLICGMADNLTDIETIEAALRKAAEAADATVLSAHLHQFSDFRRRVGRP